MDCFICSHAPLQANGMNCLPDSSEDGDEDEVTGLLLSLSDMQNPLAAAPEEPSPQAPPLAIIGRFLRSKSLNATFTRTSSRCGSTRSAGAAAAVDQDDDGSDLCGPYNSPSDLQAAALAATPARMSSQESAGKTPISAISGTRDRTMLRMTSFAPLLERSGGHTDTPKWQVRICLP